MIGANDFFGEIFGSVPDGAIEWNARIAKTMVRAGLAVVIIRPSDKQPACTLTAKQAQTADLLAQSEAREAGRLGWESVIHPCGVKHAITDEKDLNRVKVKELLADGANLAISVKHSTRRLAVADIDTAEQLDSFHRVAAERFPGMGDELGLTVKSPGVRAVDGEWLHKDGGHIWFEVPDDVELPTNRGKFSYCPCHGFKPQRPVCPSAWALYWGSGYVLVPPSVRPEGPYRLVGGAVPLLAWLVDMTAESAPSAPENGADGALGSFSDDPIDQWSAEHPWSELLAAAGFTPASHDSCGCETWTRPGSPAHTKSVTAHEPGTCSFPWTDDSSGHFPMHVWSDALGGDRSVTKLDFYAESNDITRGQAMERLGLGKLRSAELAVLDMMDLASPKDSEPVPSGGDSDVVDTEGDSDVTGASDDWTQDPELLLQIKRRALDLYVNDRARDFLQEIKVGQSWTPPAGEDDFSIAMHDAPEEPRYAIEKVLSEEGNAMISAQWKSGKTTLVLEVIRALCDEDKFLGVYDVRTSGNVALWNYELSKDMMDGWLRDTNMQRPERLRRLNLRGNRIPLETKQGQEWAIRWLAEREIRTWIIDPAVRAMIGWGSESSNDDVTVFTDALDTIKARAGVSEMIIAHHTGRAEMEAGTERARGATRWDDWPDARWILTRQTPPLETRFLRMMDRNGGELPERALAYDRNLRRVSLVGDGDPLAGTSRQTAAEAAFRVKVLEFVTVNPGLGQNAIMRALGVDSVRKIKTALEGLADGRRVYHIAGPNNSKQWFPGGFELPTAGEGSEPGNEISA
jgi:hypothetical protein